MPDTSSEEELIKRGTRLARQSALPDAVASRKELAEILVDLRQLLGDIPGTQRPYRNCVTKMYDDAGLSEGDRARVRSGVKHHVSQALRRRLSSEELAEHNLSEHSQNDRRAARRGAGNP